MDNMDNQINMTVFNDGGNPYRELLETFLKLPLGGTDEIFALFASLPGAIFCEGKGCTERFVYVPGTRKDRILLTAHADTFWDERYGVELSEWEEPKFALGLYFAASTKYGLGADDRVGCALLWGLRSCGHSLLITDGEEHGNMGAHYLRKHHKRLFREINRTHRMILALDAPGNGCYLLKGVDCGEEFPRYIEDKLKVVKGTMRGEGDLAILCKRVCGANLGVGYVNPHRNTEMFMVGGWNELYRNLYAFLGEEHPRFTVSRTVRFKRRVAERMPAVARVGSKLKRDGLGATVAACGRRVKRVFTRSNKKNS